MKTVLVILAASVALVCGVMPVLIDVFAPIAAVLGGGR